MTIAAGNKCSLFSLFNNLHDQWINAVMAPPAGLAGETAMFRNKVRYVAGATLLDRNLSLMPSQGKAGKENTY